MDLKNSALLPHILESLSQKPELCDTYENLCEDIKCVLSSENLKQCYGNVQKAIDNALDVGHSLGVITLTDDLAAPTDDSNNFAMQLRRSHTVRPNMMPHGRSRRRVSRGRRRRRGSRRRSRSRSRRR
ncbi:uncharacterized protein LOC135952491 [Calliphora vicina]|uniref:uncharacterized protein LOC135952491 n=1 Tax=Calliphora vicina TaxID=7373 RepID=UPI00325B57DE